MERMTAWMDLMRTGVESVKSSGVIVGHVLRTSGCVMGRMIVMMERMRW